MKGYALSSSVAAMPITPEIARAHVESLRRTEAMWHDYLTAPDSKDLAATANAAMWGRLAQVAFVYTLEVGKIPDDPDMCRIELIADFSQFKDVPDDFIAFHTIDAIGRPVCYINAAAAGADWTAASTHEVHESRVDGPCFGTVIAPNGNSWAREVCDSVQGSEYEEWMCAGIKVANAVGPRYFGLSEQGPLDIAGAVTEQFQQLPGGYHEETGPDGETANVYGEGVSEVTRARIERTGPRAGFRRKQERGH